MQIHLMALHGHDHIMTLSTKSLNSRVYQGNVFEMKVQKASHTNRSSAQQFINSY